MLLLWLLPAVVTGQNLYGPSQLDQYARLLNSGNIGGFGWLNNAVQQGQVRGLLDLDDRPRLQGLPPLPLSHSEVMHQLTSTSTLPPTTTSATARPTTATVPPQMAAINNVPELPPIAEERIHGKYDNDGVFHPDKISEKAILKRNQIQGTKIRDFSELERVEREAPTKSAETGDYETDDFYDDPSLRVPQRRAVQKHIGPGSLLPRPVQPPQQRRTVDRVSAPIQRRLQGPLHSPPQNQIRQPRPQPRKIEDSDLVNRAPVQVRPTLPPQPRVTYPPFVFQPRGQAQGRDPGMTNLLSEVEEYDDFLDQHRAYRERFPSAPLVQNPYRSLPEGQLPTIPRQVVQAPQLPSPALPQQQSVAPPRVGPPPQWNNLAVAAQPQAAPAFQQSGLEHPLLNIFNLFQLPHAHALAAPNLQFPQHSFSSPALAQGTLLGVPQHPLSLSNLGLNLPFKAK